MAFQVTALEAAEISPPTDIKGGEQGEKQFAGPMETMNNIRLTVVALLPEGVKGDRIKEYVDPVINGEDPSVVRTIYRTTQLGKHGQRIYVKISKLIHESEMEKGWHLKITGRFHNAGCDDVAWKMTEVDPMDIDPENTTVSLPVELFQSILESDDEEIVLPDIPLEAFGSEYFWKFFDYAFD